MRAPDVQRLDRARLALKVCGALNSVRGGRFDPCHHSVYSMLLVCEEEANKIRCYPSHRLSAYFT